MSTGKRVGGLILGVIARKRAERLLTDWVNLSHVADGGETNVRRMYSRYSEVFPEFRPAEERSRIELVGLLVQVQIGLQTAWNAADLRSREWHLFDVRQSYWRLLNAEKFGQGDLLRGPKKHVPGTDWDDEEYSQAIAFSISSSSVPPITPFEAAIFHLQQISDHALRCGNPTCPAPYFIAGKKSQRYCSEKCSAAALREAKRKWWSDNRGKS